MYIHTLKVGEVKDLPEIGWLLSPWAWLNAKGSRWHILYNESNFTFTNSQSLYDPFEQTFRESPSS